MNTKKQYIMPLIQAITLYNAQSICMGSGGFQVGGEDIQEDAR